MICHLLLINPPQHRQHQSILCDLQLTNFSNIWLLRCQWSHLHHLQQHNLHYYMKSNIYLEAKALWVLIWMQSLVQKWNLFHLVRELLWHTGARSTGAYFERCKGPSGLVQLYCNNVIMSFAYYSTLNRKNGVAL